MEAGVCGLPGQVAVKIVGLVSNNDSALVIIHYQSMVAQHVLGTTMKHNLATYKIVVIT